MKLSFRKLSFRWAKHLGVSLWFAGISFVVPTCYAAVPIADVVYYGGMIYTLTEDFTHPALLDPYRAHSVELVAVKDGKIVFAGEMDQAQRSGYLDSERVGCFANLNGKTMLPGFVASGARGQKVAADFAAAGVTTIELYDVVLQDILPRWQQAASIKNKGAWPLRVILHPAGSGELGARNRAFLGWPPAQQDGGQESSLEVKSTAAESITQHQRADGVKQKLLVTGADLSNFHRAGTLFPLASHQLFLGAWRLTLDEPRHMLLPSASLPAESTLPGESGASHVFSELPNVVALYHSKGQTLNIQAAGGNALESAVTALEQAVLASSVTDARHSISPASMAARHHVARLAGRYENLDSLALDNVAQKNLGQWSDEQVLELGTKMAGQRSVLVYDMAAVAEWQSGAWSALGRGASANLSPSGWSVAYGMPFGLQRFAPHNVIDKRASQQAKVDATVSDSWTPLVQVQAAVLRLPREQTEPVAAAFAEPRALPLSDVDAKQTLVAVNGAGFDLSATFCAPTPDGTEGEFANYDHRVNILQALHAVTTIPAFRNHLDHVLGVIAVGRLADFVILDRNPLEIVYTDPLALENITVNATIVGGRVVYGSLDCSTQTPSQPTSGDESLAVDVRAQ